MELLQLKYFVESARCENFSMVANKYFVPASAVSVSVKKLEQELGCKLFDRSANKIRLNTNGKLFFDNISSALNLIETAKEKVSPKNNEIPQKIYMLIRTERSFINEKIIDFRQKHPNVSFHLTHSYLDANHSMYDIIIDELSSVYNTYTKKSIIDEKIKIAASVNNSLYGKKLFLSDLKFTPFITMSDGSSLNRITKEACCKAGFNPNIIIESDDPFYIRNYIKEDFGIAFYPETSWKNHTDDGICFLDVADFNYTRTTYIYLNDNKQTSNLVNEFFEFMSK